MKVFGVFLVGALALCQQSQGVPILDVGGLVSGGIVIPGLTPLQTGALEALLEKLLPAPPAIPLPAPPAINIGLDAFRVVQLDKITDKATLLDQANGFLKAAGTTVIALQTLSKVVDLSVAKVAGIVSNNPLIQTAYNALGMKQDQAYAPPLDFQCQDTDGEVFKSKVEPPNAHSVRIGDVGIVACLGDSVMAGLGTIGNDFVNATTQQGRGHVFACGGFGSVADGRTTIPNIMEDKFGADLEGQSEVPGNCMETDPECSRLNLANLPGLALSYPIEALELITRLLLDPRYDVDEWKTVHILYGLHDLCQLCVANLFDYDGLAGVMLRLTIALLKAFLKKTIVYLHVPYNVKHLYAFGYNLVCKAVQRAVCPCAVLADIPTNQARIRDTLTKISEAPEFNDRDDFTITLIHQLYQSEPPIDPNDNKVQLNILAANCLHPGLAAHHMIAVHVLDSMFKPYNARPTKRDYTVNNNNPRTFACPTKENPYLRTNRN